MDHNTLIKSAFLALACTTTSLPAVASKVIPVDRIGIEVVADDGRVFARYDLHDRSQRGSLRAYLEAERDSNYGIRIRNYSGERIGLVIAVDGRNILSGQKSHLQANEPMYVLGAHDQATYAGWRTSDTRVHRFFFTDVENSYAESWGDRSAMGVIVVAAFREIPRIHSRRESGRQEAAPEANAPGESRAGKSMESTDAPSAAGTGFGDRHQSRSIRVSFKPQRNAFTTHFLKYEWRETLVSLGIIHDTPPRNRFWPEQSGRVQTHGFAPYPPGYWNQRR